MLGFTLVPALAAISPLAVLPLISRSVGENGWASALAGEAVGTFAAIVLAWGWTNLGPALVASASAPKRGLFYRQALVVRLLSAAVVLPLTAVIAVAIAGPEYGRLAALMGLQGALISLSFVWFAVGLGKPGAIVLYDAVPRVFAAVLAALAIGAGAPVEVYPLGGIAVTVVGTTLYTRSVLNRFPALWPGRSDWPGLFKRNAPVVANDVANGAYSSIPVPFVTAIGSAGVAGFATADKVIKLGQFIPLTLGNAFQHWTGEAHGALRARRLRYALSAHALLGLLGWIVLATVGSWLTALLFGEVVAAGTELLAVLGLSFLCFSVRTSMTRHILFPAGRTAAVLRATVIASVIGIPILILGTLWIGPLGAAVGFTAIEVIACIALIRTTRKAYQELVKEPPSAL